ncbi:hypothetical protein DWV07_04265 [Dickeya zeae]|nr:hypothetical protein DWV07_04265 [Dickeya zeae]
MRHSIFYAFLDYGLIRRPGRFVFISWVTYGIKSLRNNILRKITRAQKAKQNDNNIRKSVWQIENIKLTEIE